MCPSSTSSSEPAGAAAVDLTDASAERGLIEAPETFGAGSGLRFGVIALFLATIVGTLAVDSISPMPRPKLIGSERRQVARTRAAASIWDGSRARLIENDMRVRSRVRDWLVPPFSWFLYTKLSEGKDIIVGEDGWLFLHSRARAPVSEAAVGAACVANQFAALGRLLHSRGTQLVALPIPRKAVMLEELLPRGVHPVGELDRQVVGALEARGVLTVDLQAAYAEEDPKSLFHFGDSHWTVEAELIAAEELARVLGIYQEPDERESELRVSKNEALGLDLFAWIGVDAQAVAAPWVQQYRHDMYRVFRRDDGTQVKRNNPRELGRIAIVGTSFTARRSMVVFTRHVSGEHIWNAAMPGEGPMGPLRRFLSNLQGAAWPEILVVEFPVHLILSQRGMPSVAHILGTWTDVDQTTIVGAESWSSTDGVDRAGTWTRIASLPRGRLAHTADGTVSVRLTAAVPPGRCEVQLYCGGVKLEYPWHDDRTQVVMPLIGEFADSGPVLVFMRRNQVNRLQLTKAEIVADLDPQPIASGRVEALAVRPDERWVQRVRFAGSELVPEMAALELVCGPKWGIGPVTLELAFDDEESPGPILDFEHSAPEERMVIGLGGHAGRRLKSVLLSGTGRPPRRGLLEVQLLRPLVRARTAAD